MTEPNIQPDHYNGTDPLDLMEDEPETAKGFFKWNVIKYVFRCTRSENPVEDLKKAEFYLTKLMEVIECGSSS